MKWMNSLWNWMRAGNDRPAGERGLAWPPRQLAVAHELIRRRRSLVVEDRSLRPLQADDVESAVDEDIFTSHAA